MVVTPVTLGVAAVLTFAPIPLSGWHALWLPSVALTMAWMISRQWTRSTGYALTESAIYFRSGWLNRRLSGVRFANMQTVSMRAVAHGRLHGQDAIGLRVGKVINKYKVGKHFTLDIRDNACAFALDDTKVAAEAALDGLYVIRTSLAPERMPAEEAVRSYTLLTHVERAFRAFKTQPFQGPN